MRNVVQYMLSQYDASLLLDIWDGRRHDLKSIKSQ